MWSKRSTFVEPRVRFEIRRPRRWRFTAPGWSPAKRLEGLDAIDWQRFGRLPFVCLERRIATSRHPRPMLRVGCRPAARHDAAEIRALLERQTLALREELEEVEILASTFDVILAGHRAAHVRFRYTVAVRERRRCWAMRVLARSYLVLTPGLAFTVGMCSSADERFYDEGDFTALVSSIRIGRPAEPLPGRSPTRESA